MKSQTLLTTLLLRASGAWAADQQVAVRFQPMIGGERFACGKTYAGIGTTKSTLSPRDFRFYVHNVALIDDSGKSVPLQLAQDGQVAIGRRSGARFRGCDGRLRQRHAGDQYDTAPVLRKYGLAYLDNHAEGFAHWDFASADPADMRKIADTFGLEYFEEDNQISHSMDIVLLKPDGTVAKYWSTEWTTAELEAALRRQAKSSANARGAKG